MSSPDGKLTYIDPVDLHDYWPLILEGLKKVQKHSDGWIPEDVYACLRAGTSTLHIGYEGEDYEGFVILTPMQEFDGKKLNIWIAYGTGGVVKKYLPEIEMMARRIGAKAITLASPRKGWARMFKPITTLYKKEL